MQAPRIFNASHHTPHSQSSKLRPNSAQQNNPFHSDATHKQHLCEVACTCIIIGDRAISSTQNVRCQCICSDDHIIPRSWLVRDQAIRRRKRPEQQSVQTRSRASVEQSCCKASMCCVLVVCIHNAVGEYTEECGTSLRVPGMKRAVQCQKRLSG